MLPFAAAPLLVLALGLSAPAVRAEAPYPAVVSALVPTGPADLAAPATADAAAAPASTPAPLPATGPQGLPSLSPRQAAVVDSLSTHLALAAGGVETNPLVSTSPVGLLALIGVKLGLLQVAETLPPEQRRTWMNSSSAVWGGAAVNNLFVAVAAHPVISLGAGLLSGVYFWQREDARQALAASTGAEAAVDVAGLYRGANGSPDELVLARDGSFGVKGGSVPGLGRSGHWSRSARGIELHGEDGMVVAAATSGAMVLRSEAGQALFVR